MSRRGFLKGFAATFAGAALSACTRGADSKAIPLLVQPPDIVPGKAYWYATTIAGCGALAKVRDGRPIKLEGNPEHPLTRGGLSARAQAQVLGLYEPTRLRAPLAGGEETTWGEVDKAVRAELQRVAAKKGAVRLLARTITGPTERSAVTRFLERFPGARHVVYDPLSVSAISDAHRDTHGERLLPRYHFDRAVVIVSFDADFLGTWLSPVAFTAAYRAGRSLSGSPPRLSHHVQIEPGLSLTGTNADERIRLAPEETALALAHLATRLAARAKRSIALGELAPPPIASSRIDALAARLFEARGKALCVAGANDLRVQRLVNLVNDLVGAYGHTVDLGVPVQTHQGDDAALLALTEEMAAGKVSALLVRGLNPVYDLPQHVGFEAALAKVPLTISFARHLDETSSRCRFVCPEPHALEAWGDGEPEAGLFTLQQPAIRPLGKTRSLRGSLAAWGGEAPGDDRAAIFAHWREHVLSRARNARDEPGEAALQRAFDRAVEAGFLVGLPAEPGPASAMRWEGAAWGPGGAEKRGDETLALVLYPKVSMGSGEDARNPWLQELPDPVTKAVWGNHACLSPARARKSGVRDGDIVRLTGKRPDGKAATIELPALVQPGQHDEVVAVALGYGRLGTERFETIGPCWLESRPTTPEGEPVGADVSPLRVVRGGRVSRLGAAVTLERTGRRVELARTQDHHELEVPARFRSPGHDRPPAARETALKAYELDPSAGRGEAEEVASLWGDDFPFKTHHWGLALDLNACTGCSACVVGCQAENNIPVVGRDEVRRHREMHWLRIDRYYVGDGEGDDVSVLHQPVMCQQCDNAPCETVCPVLATVHSEEGLSQQVYNRCVGTRYCANNCPYKVRRFNWFDYERGGPVERLVLNPDVTVRSRGVMEKCSFCVQRIEGAKIAAKGAGRSVRDGEVQPACVQSCPTKAVVFGDLNDPKSQLSQAFRSPRAYALLGEIGVRPTVRYLTRVRNRDAAASAAPATEGERHG